MTDPRPRTRTLTSLAALLVLVAHRAYVLENGTVLLAGEAAEVAASDHVRQAYLGI